MAKKIVHIEGDTSADFNAKMRAAIGKKVAAASPTQFTATIRHHSISRARVIDCGTDLAKAKQLAAREFRDEFQDYEITIFGQRPNTAPEVYSTRKVSARKWQDR